MTGKLAGLFVGRPTSHAAAANSKLPVGHSRPASPSEIHEQLRALNDPDTVLRGLRSLRQRLQDTDAEGVRAEYVLLKHGHEALGSVWDAQSLVRNEDVSTALLLSSAKLLEASQNHTTDQPDRLGLTDALDHFADDILARRVKYLQQQLASTVKNKANAVLYLLACIATRGGTLTARLLRALDCDVTVLVKLSHPPKVKKTEDTASKGGSLLRSWGDKDPLKRPSCALLVTLVQSVLRQADTVTVTAVITSRALMAALLHHVSVHPHVVVIETLGLLSSKALQPAQGLSPCAQAEAFSDAALLQLSYISQREGGGPRAVEAAGAAHDVLMALGTDPSHGMLPESDGREDNALDEHLAAVQHKALTSAGQTRLLRLMHKLRVTEADRHAELLLAICAGSPSMAAAYLANCTLALEPKGGSSRWLVAMTLIGQLVQSSAKVPNPFDEVIRRAHQPPAIGNPIVQAFLHRLTPACLPRAVLSKGIQHPDALVRYTTLCTLLKLVQTAQSALQALQIDIQTLATQSAHAQTPDTYDSELAAPAQHSGPFHDSSLQKAHDAVDAVAANAFAMLQQQQHQDVPFLSNNMQQPQAPNLHSQWIGMHLQLQQSLRASLPDPQSLIAVLSTLLKTAAGEAEAGAAVDSLMHESPQDESQLVDQGLPDITTQQIDSGGIQSNMTASELTSTVVMMVLTAYQQTLPEAMSDSHVDVFSLMPQDILLLPPLQQHALLELQLTALPTVHWPESSSRLARSSLNISSASVVNSGSHPSSAASFLPVLKLLTGSSSHAVCQLASEVMTRRMTDLLGGAFAPEASLWLGLLPRRPQEAEGNEAWSTCVDGVLGFMSEALASLARRPHHIWDHMKTLLEAHNLEGMGMKRIGGDVEFSLLAVCALQQALKVACSSKLSSDSRTWISAYTAAVLSQLLRIQLDPQPLCHLIIDLFSQAAHSKAGRSASAAADAKDADTPQRAQLLGTDQNSNHAEHAMVLSLPVEAQTLTCLFSFTQGLLKQWQSIGRAADPRQQQPHQQTLGAAPHDIPEGSTTQKRRKAEATRSDTMKKKHKSEASLAASPPVNSDFALQVKIGSSDQLFTQLESLARRLKASNKQGLAGSQASEEQQLPRQLHQQLLTALYQCPASVVREKLPALAELLESAQAGVELTHEGAELSVAVCRAFGIVCPVSCRMLPGIPFLLLLQGVDLCESDGALQAQMHSSLEQLPSDAKHLATLAITHQLQMVTTPAAIQLCFSLLALSLGLTPPATHVSKNMTQAEHQAAYEVVRPVDESAVRQLLQQPWVMSHWLSERPLGHDVAVAWVSGLTEILHSVLNLSLRAGSAAATALTEVCQPYTIRLISRLTAVLDQVLPPIAAASAAAVTASDAELAAVAAAASHLAIFFPQTHLLTLGQIALSCIELEPVSDSSIRASTQSCIAKLGLDLAEALIATWTPKQLQRGSYLEEEDWTERNVAAWSDIIKGLIRMALMRGAAASSSAETAADVLLLKALRKHHSSASHRCFSSCQQQLSQCLALALQSPSRTHGLIAADLIQLSPSLSADFKSHFEAQIAEAKEPINREAVACLLPAAIAYLQQLSKAAVPEHNAPPATESASLAAAMPASMQARTISDGKNKAAEGHGDVVRAFFAEQVMQYMTVKPKAAQGFDQVSQEASRNLHSHAVDVLKLCWAVTPPEAADRHQLLHRLLPTKGWPVNASCNPAGSSCEPCDPNDSAWLPLPSQRAQTAKLLLEQSLQAGNMALEDLTRFAQACLTTLATAYKHQDLSRQDQLLVHQLTDYLDSFVGDHLAEVPDQARSSGPFRALAGPISSFAAAVLKFKLDSPASIKVLRRLLAALLPDNCTDTMSESSDDKPSLGNPGTANSAIGAMACHTFDRLISHSRFVLVMLNMQDSLLPLPAAAQKLKLRSPFGSILPLVESRPFSQAASTVKGEVAELLDTLLDLQQSYPPADPSPAPATPLRQKLASLLPLLLASYGATLSSPDQSLLRVLLHVNDIIFQTDDYWHTASGTAAASAEGGQPAADVLTSAEAPHLNTSVSDVNRHQGDDNRSDEGAELGTGAGGDGRAAAGAAQKAMPDGPKRNCERPEGPITSLLNGPLATAGFLWGATAKALHEQALLMPQTNDAHHLTARTKLVRQHQQVEPARCALTDIHFPERRNLTADDTTAEPLPAPLQKLAATAKALEDRSKHRTADSDSAHRPAATTSESLHDRSDSLQSHESRSQQSSKAGNTAGQCGAKEKGADETVGQYHAAGHDPVWVLLYAVKGLQCHSITAEEMISQGLLSLSLRSLAAHDDGLRALAYEAVGLCLAALAATSPKQTQQVQVLLEALKRSLIQPFQQLPAVIATFAAEAVFVLMAPGSAMYSPVNKLLLKGPALNIEEIPLMYQLLVSGNQQHVEERSWVLHLLAAGLRGPQDAQLYRRRFVAELLMSLHDCPLADAQTRMSILHTLTAVTHVPAYAKDLMHRAGLQTWLNSLCRVSGQQHVN